MSDMTDASHAPLDEFMDQLEALLLEGMNSAESELTDDDWIDIRKEALLTVNARKQKTSPDPGAIPLFT